MIDIKKERFYILALAILFAVLVRFQQNAEISRIFQLSTASGTIKYWIVFIFSFLVSIVFFYFFLWSIFELGRWKRPEYVCFFRYFFIYLAILSIILLCMWPGYFRADEKYTLAYALADLQIYWYQSFYSFLLMVTSIMILPYLAFITFFQLVIISIFAALSLCSIRKCLQKKWLTYYMYIPFCLLPILNDNQLVMRNSIICWIVLYITVKTYAEFKLNAYFSRKTLVTIITCLIFIGTWKTEMFCLLPCYLVIFFLKNNSLCTFKKILQIGVFSLCVMLLFSFPSHFEGNNNYILTTVLTPISKIVIQHKDDCPDDLKDAYETVTGFISYEELVPELSSIGTNVPRAYWEKPVMSSTDKKQYMCSALRLLWYYKADFIQNRIDIYKYTNGFVKDVINQVFSNSIIINGENFFLSYFKYTNLAIPELKNYTINILSCRKLSDYMKTNCLFPIFYNVTYVILALWIILFGAIWKRKPLHICICASLLIYSFVIFWLAPACYFMYYTPLYLTGYSYFMMLILKKIDSR